MSFAKRMLIEQRRRMVGALMQHIEDEVYPHLPEPEQAALRRKVLASVGQYHDVCLDILKAATSSDMVVNDEALRMITAMHADVRRALRDRDG